MKSLLLRDVGLLELLDTEPPQPGEDEVVVDVALAGVCGSDIHSARDGGLLRTPPIVMGHEFSGTVNGRRVVVHPFLTCGHCDLCRRGLVHLCRNRSIIGIHQPGGFADQVAVPRSALIDLADDVSLEAAAMIEPLAVALHAFRLHEPQAEQRVGVLGAGTIGLLVAMLCADHGVPPFVADLDRARRRHAEELGAVGTAEGLQGEFDVVFDAAGASATHRASLDSLRPGGTTVWVGNENADAAFDAQDLVQAQKTVIGSAAYTRGEFEHAATIVDDRVLAWTGERPLHDGVRAFEELMTGGGGASVKTLLRP